MVVKKETEELRHVVCIVLRWDMITKERIRKGEKGKV